MISNSFSHPARRGLTLLELILGISITTLITAAIAAMCGSVATGITTRHDARSVMLRANAVQTRLAAYIAPARSILDVTDTTAVIWFNDNRESNTVHASEIRWITFDQSSHSLVVEFIQLPEDWSEGAQFLADQEYAPHQSWDTVLSHYRQQDLVHTRLLSDSINSLDIYIGSNLPHEARQLLVRLAFQTNDIPYQVATSAAIRLHSPPELLP